MIQIFPSAAATAASVADGVASPEGCECQYPMTRSPPARSAHKAAISAAGSISNRRAGSSETLAATLARSTPSDPNSNPHASSGAASAAACWISAITQLEIRNAMPICVAQ